jgi:hypothetical protein
MLLWTTDQFGEPGRYVRVMSEWQRNTYTGEQTSTAEKTVNVIPGLSGLLKVSDRGATEQQWESVEEEDREAAKLRLSMPQNVRDMLKERYRLNRLGAERLDEQDRSRLSILNSWYGSVYEPAREGIKLQDTADKRKALQDATEDVHQNMTNRSRPLPVQVLGGLAERLTEPRPKKKVGERMDAYEARKAEHDKNLDLAIEALQSTGSIDYATLRDALKARFKAQGHSITTQDEHGNDTAYGARLRRIKSRIGAN